MTYETLGDVNTTAGLHTIFVHVNTITSGLFSRLTLFAFFIILAIGSYLSGKRLGGRGDLPASLAIAGFVTTGAAIIMSFVDGLINPFDIVVSIAATVLFVLWLYMSKKQE